MAQAETEIQPKRQIKKPNRMWFSGLKANFQLLPDLF
jgi:hypothetical protein